MNPGRCGPGRPVRHDALFDKWAGTGAAALDQPWSPDRTWCGRPPDGRAGRQRIWPPGEWRVL